MISCIAVMARNAVVPVEISSSTRINGLSGLADSNSIELGCNR
ncbi:Uncharacterised protein [Mycobacteroides abscessus subsp. abscessus]|nr:Uncharacterised protein [Mycobacteroides abscessus subsp. abscessus]